MNVIRRAAAGIALALSLVGCGASRDDVIEAQLAQAVQTTGGELQLARYVRGDWDRFCKVNAGTTRVAIDSLLGFAWPAAERSGITESNAHTLLVFITDGAVVEEVMFPIEKGSFPGGNYCMNREDARFHVVQDSVDLRVRQLVPVDRSLM